MEQHATVDDIMISILPLAHMFQRIGEVITHCVCLCNKKKCCKHKIKWCKKYHLEQANRYTDTDTTRYATLDFELCKVHMATLANAGTIRGQGSRHFQSTLA